MKFESSVWRDVFQNFKDTRLFIDVLKSTTAIHSDSTQNTPAVLLDSVESIQKFITLHTSNYKLHKCKFTKKDEQERNIDVKRRQHAVLFFSILKKLKVTSSEADAYYETVNLEPCNIIWYFDLLCHLHWHECFIHSAKQLPDNIMLYVCEEFLTLESENRSFSLCYVIMQSIIFKLFMLEDPQIATDEEELPKFCFPFAHPEVLTEENNEGKLITLYKLMLQKCVAQNESEKLKLLLHAVKLIFKILLRVKTFKGSFVKDLFYLTASHIGNELPNDVKNSFPDCDVQDSVYREESAGTSLEYLILTVAAYSDKVETLIAPKESIFSVVASDLKLLLNRTRELIGNSFLVQEQFEEYPKIPALLEAVIQNNYPCSSKAAEIIFDLPNISPKFIEVLHKNKEVLNNERNLILLLNAVLLNEANEELFIILLFDILSNTPQAVYYNILKYRIRLFGTKIELKHPAFYDQIDQFSRKTLDYEEAEKIILPLLVQSPYKVLYIILAQALDQGKKGMDLIKVLTNVTDLIYSGEANLLTEITLYISSKEEKHLKELKHVPLVIETIVKNTPGNIFEKVMEMCILPHLVITDRLEIILNCLNVALQSLENNESQSLKSQIVIEYLEKCGTLLNDCIISHKSKTKEQVIEGISMIALLFQKDFILDHGDIVRLRSHVKDYNPLVFIYIKNYLGFSVYEILENPAVSLNELMWTWSCFTKDQEIFQKCISQPQFSHKELLKVLKSALLHFTLEEWIQSSLFIKINCSHLHPFLASSKKPWKLNEDSFRIYATVKCLLDCISSILKNNNDASTYPCSNFTNTVMNLLDGQHAQPECLLYIFMDTCVLIDVKDFWIIFSSFLIAILKQTYESCKNESQEKIFKTLFINVLKHLPESEGKLDVLNAV